jgi:hypothetical protein
MILIEIAKMQKEHFNESYGNSIFGSGDYAKEEDEIRSGGCHQESSIDL